MNFKPFLILALLVYSVTGLTEITCSNKECICSNQSLKCNFNNSTHQVIFIESTNVTSLELTMNSLDTIVLPKKSTNLKELILRCNRFKSIPVDQFINVPQLATLDLSMNRIESLSEITFQSVHQLRKINLSESLAPGFKLDRQLCELVSLEVIDLSYLDIGNFTLGCWKSIKPNVIELHLRHTKNLETSWAKWFPFIGNTLRKLDITGTNLITIDSTIARKMSNLHYISLSHNPNLDKNSLIELLKTENFIERLTNLHLANISSYNSNFSLDRLINHANNISLIELDISSNNFSDIDLNAFLFNQARFKRLQVFKASNSNFSGCDRSLLSSETTLLPSLQDLDLSYNSLSGAKCLYSIMLCSNLRRLDLSHNKLEIMQSDFVTQELVSMFADMTNLSYIDLSYNQIAELTLYFQQHHTTIRKFDISHNSLRKFRFLSMHTFENAQFPLNIEYDSNSDYYDETDIETLGNVQLNNEHDKTDPKYLDDDERFIVIEELNLASNHLKHVNLHHMMQSIRNVKKLDFSHNPIESVIRLSGERSLLGEQVLIDEDDLTEILCIDELDLSNCHVRFMPNLEHTCVNKIRLAYNKLYGKQHLIISRFTTFFLDYVDLQWNNVTELKPIISSQKFKQDSYTHKNSPMEYYLGTEKSVSASKIHTYVDLKHNQFFTCDCENLLQFQKYAAVQLLNECADQPEFHDKCVVKHQSLHNLNQKFRLLFGFISLLLVLLTAILVYYMCSDCVKNMQPYERIQYLSRQFVNRLTHGNMESDGIGPTGNVRQTQASKVIYSKLDNETNTSNVNLDIHS